jgi:hypothetical protein
MGGDSKPRIGEAVEPLSIMGVKVNVVDLIAGFADEVLVLGNQWIEMLGAPNGEHLQLTRANELLKIAVDSS